MVIVQIEHSELLNQKNFDVEIDTSVCLSMQRTISNMKELEKDG